MANRVRFDIELSGVGWATIRLIAPDVQLEFEASYTPQDSIGELARAAAGLLAGLPEQVVVWNTEPVEYEFRFVTERKTTRLQVHQFPDIRRRSRQVQPPVAMIEGDAVEIARSIWRGLRRLQGAVTAEIFAESWRHPFPSSVVERIEEQLRMS